MTGRTGIPGRLVLVVLGVFLMVQPASGQEPDAASCAYFLTSDSPLEILQACADSGNAVAQFSLGSMYDSGEGVPEDDAEAARWYRLSAVRGYGAAQSNLGVLYEKGEGVPEDLVLAYMWYALSAAQGDRVARGNREAIERRMTLAQIAEAQKRVLEWLEQHRPPPRV